MKRRQLLNHLDENDCVFKRHGAKHDVYQNTKTGKRTSVPRHTEIDDKTARKICKQLEIPPV